MSNIIKESIDQVLQNQQYIPVKVRAAAVFPFPPPRERTSRALTAGTLAARPRRDAGQQLVLADGGALPEAADGPEQAVQVHRDLRDHAEERGRAAHVELLLLGQLDRRQPDGAVGEQEHVLHSHRLWRGHLTRPAQSRAAISARGVHYCIVNDNFLYACPACRAPRRGATGTAPPRRPSRTSPWRRRCGRTRRRRCPTPAP